MSPRAHECLYNDLFPLLNNLPAMGWDESKAVASVASLPRGLPGEPQGARSSFHGVAPEADGG